MIERVALLSDGTTVTAATLALPSPRARSGPAPAGRRSGGRPSRRRPRPNGAGCSRRSGRSRGISRGPPRGSASHGPPSATGWRSSGWLQAAPTPHGARTLDDIPAGVRPPEEPEPGCPRGAAATAEPSLGSSPSDLPPGAAGRARGRAGSGRAPPGHGTGRREDPELRRSRRGAGRDEPGRRLRTRADWKTSPGMRRPPRWRSRRWRPGRTTQEPGWPAVTLAHPHGTGPRRTPSRGTHRRCGREAAPLAALAALGDQAEPGTVVVSAAAAPFLARRFELAPDISPAVKPRTGWSGPPAPSARLATRFVGRESELGLLRERLRQAEAGQGQIVSIVGEPGIGKSRLLREFRRQVADDATWMEGQSIAFGRTMAFHPLIDLVRRAFQIDEADPKAVIVEKIELAVLAAGRGSPAGVALLAIPPVRRSRRLHHPPTEPAAPPGRDLRRDAAPSRASRRGPTPGHRLGRPSLGGPGLGGVRRAPRRQPRRSPDPHDRDQPTGVPPARDQSRVPHPAGPDRPLARRQCDDGERTPVG